MKSLIHTLVGKTLYLRLHIWKKRIFGKSKDIEKQDFLKRKRFYASFVQKGDLCFDVGANLGNRIEPLLALGARVVAVEPQEFCYTELLKKFGNRIELVKKGLGEKEETKEFFVADAHTISSFSVEFIEKVKNGRFKQHQWSPPIEVEMTTLDALIETFGTPRFIKIDVEGYELEVLKGLSSPVNMISFEYMVPEQTAKVLACMQQLEIISADCEYNFSVGESMSFANERWLSPSEMKTFVQSKAFNDTEFGDVYCRHRP
ncbi:FkbM family methyltransferase [Arundinibacter roseus]|uniref:FkbM family methyltransferase n=1 Tax=Arundinibacter roseus TaxID=2070510 RepID=A0A4R4KA86_9BACT|nr:FkbM family methyltransferase [Arundinibacter roseus]TDB63466.1 FkbM family methyltransferase [Arundinibacter roseus]